MRLNWARTARRRAKLGKHAGSSSRRRWTNKLALGAGCREPGADRRGGGGGDPQAARPPGRSRNPEVAGLPDYLETTPEGWRFAAQPRRKN